MKGWMFFALCVVFAFVLGVIDGASQHYGYDSNPVLQVVSIAFTVAALVIGVPWIIVDIVRAVKARR